MTTRASIRLASATISASDIPPEGHPGHDPMMADLRRAVDAHATGGRVRLEYDCRVYLTRL